MSLHHSFRENQTQESFLISQISHLNQQKFCHSDGKRTCTSLFFLKNRYESTCYHLLFKWHNINLQFPAYVTVTMTHNLYFFFYLMSDPKYCFGLWYKVADFHVFQNIIPAVFFSKICPIKYQARYHIGNKTGYNMKALMISSVLVSFYVLWQLLLSYHTQWLPRVTSNSYSNEAYATEFI